MITEIGAVKVRGGEVLGEFQTLVNPHTPDPAVHRGAHRHHQLDGRRRAADRVGAAGVPRVRGRARVLVAHNAPFDVGFLKHFAARQGRPWPRVRGARHRQARPPGDHPRRRAQLQALLAGRASSAPTTTPNHRALSDARATVDVLHGLMERLGGLGVHTLEELQTFTARVIDRPAPQAPPRRGAAPRPGRLPVPRRPRRGSSTSAPPATCAPGSAPTSPPPRPAPGWARWSASPSPVDRHRVRHPARGRGPRAAADRRAQAALQPPLPLPREGPLPQAHPRAVAAAVAGAPGRSTTTPTTSARSPASKTAEKCLAALHETFPLRQCTQRLGRAAVAGRRACSPRWAAASPRATAASTPTTYAAVVRQLRDNAAAPARRRGRG